MYRSLASETSITTAEIYKEIRRCLRLRGGKVINGVKWIWKTANELAELFGINERTVRRHLKKLIDLGWLARQQWDKRWGKRQFYYTLGEKSPLQPVPDQNGHPARSNADKRSVSKTSKPLPNNSLPARTAKTTNSRGPERVPAHWPEPATKAQTRLAIEDLRNQIGWLNRGFPCKSQHRSPVVRAF